MTTCPYGFYCPPGTSAATSNPCPTNFFCGGGSASGTGNSCTTAVPMSTWFDADGDGDLDAVGSTALGGMLLVRDASSSANGDCNGGLTRGMPVLSMASMQRLAYADVDGDGDDDVLGVTYLKSGLLLVNNGSGHFVDASASSGLVVAANETTAVTVGDVDGDGDVDLFVGGTTSSLLMQNNGSGVFTDVTNSSVFPSAPGSVVATTLQDVDGDGDLDLFVLSTTGHRLYVNAGGGTLVESGASRGVTSSLGGVVRGSAAADVDGDGDTDVLVFGSGPAQLYMNNGTGWFVDSAALLGAQAADNATSASFEDVDNDGDLDLLIVSSALQSVLAWNNGTGGFSPTSTTVSSALSAAPVFVDVDGDGDMDAPAIGFVNGVVPTGVVGTGVASVRVLSRSGRRICHGATILVRRSSDGAIVTSRRVSSGIAPYDVHVAAHSLEGVAVDVELTFPSGRRHTKATQAALSGVRLSTSSSPLVPIVVAHDTPAIMSVQLFSSGVRGPGSDVTAVVRALGDEVGLSAAAACVMNGVIVTASMVDLRNGSYIFSYVVQASHSSTSVVTTSFQLTDPRWGVSSDVASTVFGSGQLTVDTTPPVASFIVESECSPENDTITGTANQTVCVLCGSLSAEPFGCAVWLRVNGSSPWRVEADRVNNSVIVLLGPYLTGQKPIVVAWSEDAAGNVGPDVVLTWEVDLLSPLAVWTPRLLPAFSNRTSISVSFGCSHSGCSFDYSFDNGPRVRLGGNSVNATGEAATMVVDTALEMLPERFSRWRNATASLAAVVNGMKAAIDNSGTSNVTVEVKLDADTWTDVRVYDGAVFDGLGATQRLLMSGLSDGVHTLHARARVSDDVADRSPWSHVWMVDTVSPNVTFSVTPPQVSAAPQCTAVFVLAADEDAASFEVQWRALNTSVNGDVGTVNDSAWIPANSSVVSLTGLAAGTHYALHARAVDRAGNTGGVVSWGWSSWGCPLPASVAAVLSVQTHDSGVDSRAVVWSLASESGKLPSEVQYRLNDGPWLRTSDRPILLRGLTPATQYRVDVRPAVPCGCEAVIPQQASSSASWFNYERAPGRAIIVSAPALSSNSLFGDFELSSTARDVWLEYSLDGGSFSGCSSRVRVGPLSLGVHNVTIRSVDALGNYIAAHQVFYSWFVLSAASSTLEMTEIRDGAHSLKVWAVAGLAEERSPRTVRWVVDTLPPTVSVLLVTPLRSNLSEALLSVSCLNESRPSLCVYCTSVSVNGGAFERWCSSNQTVAISMAEDGLYEAKVSSTDAAGNEGVPTVVSWTRDTTPNTSAVVDTARTPVFQLPLLSMIATNASMIFISALSSETGGGLAVTLDGVAVGAGLMSGPSIVVNVSFDGVHTVAIAAVDESGNVDPTPAIVVILVDTTMPSTTVAAQPAPVINTSTAVMSWRATGESAGTLSHFELHSTPPLTMLPSSVAPDDGGFALLATLTLVNISSGAYTLTARAVDAVGHVDITGANIVFVVDVDAPSSHFVHSLAPFVNRSHISVSVNSSDALSLVSSFVRVDGGPWQSASGGAVSLTLADGPHMIECRGIDAAGNVQPPPYAALHVTVDTIPPIVSVAPVPTFDSLSVVSMNVSVSDATSTTVRGVLDGSLGTEVSCVGDGVLSFGIPADGNHTVLLHSQDAAGNVGGVVSVSWFTDREPPITSASLVGAVFIRETVATIALERLNEEFPQLCTACWQYAVMTPSGSTLTSASGCELKSTLSFSYTHDGVATVDVLSVDAAGNVGGNASRVTWTWDRAAPDTTVSVEGGVWLPTLLAWGVSTDTPVMSVIVDEAAASLVLVQVDGVSTNISVSPSLSTFTLPSMSEGLHHVTVAGIDLAGNPDATPAIMAVFVDTVTPVTVVSHLSALLTNESRLSLLLTAVGESNGTMEGFELSSEPASAAVPPFVNVSDGSLTVNLTLMGMSSGEYSITVRAVDVVGHRDAIGANFRVVVDLEAPATRLFHSLASLVNYSSVNVGVNATDALSSVTSFVRVDDGPWRLVPGPSESANPATVLLTLADGAHRIECRGVDAAGNAESPPYDGVDVRVDTTPPSVVVADNAVHPFNALSVVSVPVTVSDASPTTLIVRGVLDGAVDTAVSRVGSGVVSVVVTADGNHTLVLSSEDAAGNVGAATVSWYTDSVPPVTSVEFLGPASLFVRNASASISLSYVHEVFPQLCVACWQYTVVNASGFVLTSTGSCQSALSLSFAYTLDGFATVDVFSVDAAGNIGNNASRVMWTWDHSAPDTSVMVEGGARLPGSQLWLINNSTVTLLLSSSESAHFAVHVDGVMLPSPVRAPSLQLSLAAGHHTVLVNAVDVAGNVDDSPVVVAVVVDVIPPASPRFQLQYELGCFVMPLSPVFVCNSSNAVAFTAACNEATSNQTAPCFVEWRMDTVSVSGGGSGSGCVIEVVGVNASLSNSWTRANSSLVLTRPSSDGQYRVWWRASDAAGNAGSPESMLLWLDTTPPSKEPTFVVKPDAVSFLTSARFELQVVGDASPGRLAFVYELTRGAGVEPLATAPLPEPTNDDAVQLQVGDMVGDVSYTLRAWTRDQAGHRSVKAALHAWSVVSVAPTVEVSSRPSPASVSARPVFVFAAVWGNGTSKQGAVPEASFLVSLVGVTSPHSPCDEQGAAPNCTSWCNGSRCEYAPRLDTPQAYTLQVQAVLGGRAGDVVSILWEYRRCRSDQFAVITAGDSIDCKACPDGGDCSPVSSTDIVTQSSIVARAGYWASPSSDGSRFYRCPILGSCVGGGNGSRAACATGYAHVACSLCDDGYFEQFGLCVPCPKSSGTSIGALFGLSLLFIAICGALYTVRKLLPIDVIKLGVSMVQIIASANSAYDIPWPSVFRRFLSLLRVFLVDVVAITQASCAQPMDYYASMMVLCVGLMLLLALLLLGPWAWSKLSLCNCRLTRAVHDLQVRRRVSAIEASMSGGARRRQSALVNAMAATIATAHTEVGRINWTDVFKASFMLLFIAYPGVSLKVLRLFKCREIEAVWWLAADMRLRCYDGRWAGFALFGIVIAIVYIVGLPAAVLWILWRRRHKLFGSPTDPFVASTRAAYGFLYVDYGDSAWWWEAEELVRKLLLSAVVVLIEEGSPLQVTLAVLVSGWAHVLHAQYKPWGGGSVLYRLQHGALFVTSFVFLMGLLFKVEGVSSSTVTYGALSGIMVALCAAFIAAWVAVVVKETMSMWRALHRNTAVSEPLSARGQLASKLRAASPFTGGRHQGGHSRRLASNGFDDSRGPTVDAFALSDASDVVITNPIPRLALYSKIQRLAVSGTRGTSASRLGVSTPRLGTSATDTGAIGSGVSGRVKDAGASTASGHSATDTSSRNAASGDSSSRNDASGDSSSRNDASGDSESQSTVTAPVAGTLAFDAAAAVAEAGAVLMDGAGASVKNPVFAMRTSRRLRSSSERALPTTVPAVEPDSPQQGQHEHDSLSDVSATPHPDIRTFMI